MDGDTKHGPDRVEDDDPLAVTASTSRPEKEWAIDAESKWYRRYWFASAPVTLAAVALAPLRLVVRTCDACATAKFDAQQALDGLAKSSENAEVTSGACDGECAGPSVSVEIDGEPAVCELRTVSS